MKKDNTSHHLLHLVIVAAGGSSAALGLIVLVGWHTRTVILIQVDPALAPMQYNTALGFLLCGVGLLSLVYSRLRLAMICGAVVAAIALLTLSQYIFMLDLGIDQLLMEPYITVGTSHPGRMAPNSALSLVLSGAALLIASSPVRLGQRALITGLLSSVIAGLGLVAFSGYLTGVETTYGWGHLTRMAVQSAFGFVVLGTGIFIFAWCEGATQETSAPRWLAIPIGIVVVTFALTLWQALDAQEQAQIERTIEAEANNVRTDIMALVETRVQALLRMAKRWEIRGGTPRKEWESDVTLHMAHQLGYQAIQRVDPSFQTRWIVPLEENEATLTRDLAFEEWRRVALERGRDRREATVTSVIDLVHSGKGFLVYVPLFLNGDFDGFIQAVFRVQELLDPLLGERFARGYAIAVFEGTEEIYSRYKTKGQLEATWGWETEIELPGVTWRVRIWPEAELLAEQQSALPEVALVTGLLMALLLALTVHLGQTARLQAKEVESANRELAAEIVERRLAEETVRQAHDELERRVKERTAELQAANEALRESEEKYHQLYDTAPDMFVSVDPKTAKIIQCNQTLATNLGYTKAEIIGRPIFDLYHPDCLTEAKQAFESFAKTGQVHNAELQLKRNEGSKIDVILNVSAVRDEQGHILYSSSIWRDITKRKRAEERFRLVVESTPSAFVVVDQEGKIALVNSQTEQLFGYKREELVGQLVEILIPERFRHKHPEDRSGFLTKPVARVMAKGRQLWGLRKDGSEVPIEIGLSPMESEDGLLILSAIVDITEHKQAEEALARKTAELERSNQELEQFAYVASHDLEEPLRMVSSYLQLLERRYKDKLDAGAQEFIVYAVDGAERMKRLIHDLLSYSRVGMQGKQFELTNCEAVLDQALANLHLAIEERRAVVTRDSLPSLMADEGQLVQVFQNLIGNAIKFCGDQPPQIHVGVECKAGKYVFSVSDNGVGIDPESVERIFVIFQRLHGRTEYPGTGLGLAICKKIVERHGGRIWVESEPGRGSTFYFTIPATSDQLMPLS